jgi:carbamoylphosphate synthase large subunit
VLGTDPVQIDTAEDRHKFSSVLDKIGVDQPEWTEATSLEAAKGFADVVGSVGQAPFCFCFPAYFAFLIHLVIPC